MGEDVAAQKVLVGLGRTRDRATNLNDADLRDTNLNPRENGSAGQCESSHG
jgi:hypothetical protein